MIKRLILSLSCVAAPALGGDMPLYVSGCTTATGYCVPYSKDMAITAAHIVINNRKLAHGIRFLMGESLVTKEFLCKDRDLCLLQVTTDLDTEIDISNGEGELTLRDKAVEMKELTPSEIYLQWEDWIECGMSGAGIYASGKLLAILSRIKRGEYAVGILIAPMLKRAESR